jgi:dihydrofolate reductase
VGRRRARLRPADPDGHRLAHHSRRRARWRRLHFVRSPREAADVAIGLAGGKDVDLFSASIGGQLLRVGLVGEVRIHLAPVLLGAGTRLLDDDDEGHIRLQPTRITESSKATHLRYRVLTVEGTG